MSLGEQHIKHKLSVSDYYRMGDAGILQEDDRIELIEGELIDKAPIGSRHVALVNKISRVLNKLIGDNVIFSVQNPVRCGGQRFSDTKNLTPKRISR
ncbi:MAG: hypothetical protein CTY34_11195 [Methylobacter sp.]|nr:MAG: hypothetical protein CTY34_11195 [Methylobacter sp.]PPD19036.1 MAG: hypothetical protein CTY24_11920 [Methylobacter sp.]PPD32196.1 MAG: hypothetical protein CTY18_11515 [Methylomonas sp.]